MRKRAALIAAVVIAVIVIAGCGRSSSSTDPARAGAANPNAAEVNPAGDIPDNQAYVPVSPTGGTFSVKVPEGWAQSKSGSATTFTDKLNSITIEATPASAALTVREAKQADLPKLAAAQKGFVRGRVDVVRRSAGPALRITYQADSKPDPVTGKVTKDAVERYVFFHNGERVVLTLSGPKGADNVDPWKIVTDSLRWTR